MLNYPIQANHIQFKSEMEYEYEYDDETQQLFIVLTTIYLTSLVSRYW